MLAGGGAVAGGLLLAFLRRRKAAVARVQAGRRQRASAIPAPGALARGGTGSGGPFRWPSRVLPNADSLRALVLTVITNVRAPVAVRNACHHLMLAIEQNNQTLVDEILVSLARAADRTGFLLPPLVASAAG
jgi:hypothetical protein